MSWNRLTLILPPLLCLALLGGIMAEKSTHLTPEDADPYHERAREAIEGVPLLIGYWAGRDEIIAPEAVRLLRPNKILSRRYVNTDPTMSHGRGRTASLLIVQTRDSRDMLGHYPPVCYVAHGETQLAAVERDWEFDGFPIHAMEYQFQKSTPEGTFRRSVYNFMVVPGQDQTIRNMNALRRAAKDYQLRHFGAAQFQVVMSGDTPQDERDEIFRALIGPNVSVVQTIQSMGETQ